jgi:hypothetical protein
MMETPQEARDRHIQRHQLLHAVLDELVADFIRHTDRLPMKATVWDLMSWSYQQTMNPTEIER